MENTKKVLNNNYLMDYIYEFDNTYRETFKKEIIYKLDLLESTNDFWYDKYEKSLKKNNLKKTLEFQNIFLDTLYLLQPHIFE